MKLIRQNLLFLLLLSFYNCVVIIPFKTYYQKEPDDFNATDVVNYWEKNVIYSDSSIGTPGQKIILILDSQSHGTNLFEHMCDLSGSSYIKEKSSTFYLEKVINSYYPMNNASIINETLFFYDNFDLKELKPLNNFRIIYSDNDEKTQKDKYEYHQYTCINVGLGLSWIYYHDVPTNLIKQIKKGYNLETYDFTFEYSSEDEGRIIIGAEPHIYDPDNYFESQSRIVGAEGSNNERDWFLNFNKLYHTYKVKSTGYRINETFGTVKSLRIQFDMGIMIGPNSYKESIKLHFFDDLINEGKCFEERVIDGKTIFYCDKSAEKNITNDFPTLYFEMKIFNKVFELTYKDLFREKNGKIYFLIYFRDYSLGDYFTIGKIFLKKYSFTFNLDTKMIGYYNIDLPGGKKNKNEEKIYSFSSKYKALIISLIIVLVIIFGIFGFYLGKFVYDKVRKKRINELDDNYDYDSHENFNFNKNDNNNNYMINDNNE